MGILREKVEPNRKWKFSGPIHLGFSLRQSPASSVLLEGYSFEVVLICTVVCFLLANLLLLTSAAQQMPVPDASASPQTQPTDKTKSQNQTPKTTDKNQGTSNDRLFYALPNFLTLENGGQVPPLTVGQKFKVVTRGSFDYIQIPWYGLLAGISQAENSEPGYGQGAEGYGKRLGAYFADGTIENYMTGSVFPSLLRQDPRFFQSGKGGFLHRTGYAVSRIFVTRTDSGHRAI